MLLGTIADSRKKVQKKLIAIMPQVALAIINPSIMIK
jgi:hypothetical protein